MKSLPEFTNNRKPLYLLVLGVLLPCFSTAKIPEANPTRQHWHCNAKGDEWQCYQNEDPAEQLFASEKDGTPREQAVAKALGWVSSNEPENYCGGYYYSPKTKPAPPNKTKVSGGKARYKIGGDISIQGGVEVKQGRQEITAEKVTLKPNPKTKKIETIESKKDVSLRSPGQLVISKSAKANIKENTARLTDTYYLLEVQADPTGTAPEQYEDPHFTGYGRGRAKEVIQHDKNHYTLKDAYYTTGSPYDHSWKIGSSEIDINRESGWATTYNSLFYVQDVPIMYLPYMTFPINRERKTGVLFPKAGNINGSYYYKQPVYFNLAPNYDLLFTPGYYTERGLMLEGNFNYMTETNSGTIGAQFMPYDREYGGTRGMIGIIDEGHYGEHWASSLDVSWASDSTFIRDFSNDLFAANQSLLTQEGSISYLDDHTFFDASLLNYQVLDEVLTPINTPYSTLPQIDLNFEFPNTVPNLSFGIDDQFTYFYKEDLAIPDTNTHQKRVTGQRMYAAPYIAAPFERSWGHINPNITLSNTLYNLQNNDAISGTDGNSQRAFPDNPHRIVPIVNVDAGLNFERDFTYKEESYNQTLEPKLFYTYIPYRDQNDIPLFDTQFTNFTYASLFRKNRFTSIDRINNANQLSYALETNITSNESGTNILSAGVGQMYYMTEQRVTLCNSASSGCTQNQFPKYGQTLSDVAAYVNYQFLQDWYLHSNISYKPGESHVSLQSYNLQYKSDPRHIFNVGYENILNDYSLITPQEIQDNQAPPELSQVTTSALWGLNESISLVGMWTYSFNFQQTLNVYGGLQYDQCSWAIRAMYQRFISNVNANNPKTINGKFTNSFMISFELKGLGSAESGDMQSNLNMIPGYEPYYSGFE